MNDVLIYRSIKDILAALRWQESRDGTSCHISRDNALRVVLALLNRVSSPVLFTNTRRELFRLMNEAKKNLSEK